jgi:CRP-like cAMP-binding protein
LSGLSARAATAVRAASNGSERTIALLRVDAGLRGAIPPDDVAFAERLVVAPRRELDAGPWCPDMVTDDSTRPLGALVLDGVVSREITLADRCSVDLLGPGDVFRPWRALDTILPCTARWTTTGAAIAILDERFVTAARRWPGLYVTVHERVADQADRAALRTAIGALPRVEERVLALFWHLAERWGVVRGDGVVVRLALTHALIGQLVGAQRPTVSLALHALADDGLLHRTGPSAWTLRHGSRETLGGDLDAP